MTSPLDKRPADHPDAPAGPLDTWPAADPAEIAAGPLDTRPAADPAVVAGPVAGGLATVERRAVEVVGLLGGLIARLRTPLLAVTLLPLLPAVGLLIAAVVVGTATPAVIAIAGLVAPVWLTVRRRQLVTALVPADAAVADLKRTFDLAAIGGQLRDNLLRQDGRRLSLRPRALAGSVWRGISTTAALHGRVTDVPRLAPFFPGRLRGLAFLSIACVVSGVVLTAWLVLHLVLAALVGADVWSGF
ncbi:hypothetical protein [Nakamurella deserti]|uniref:hypothetical protein n=1 Tax=Nakamurella deserti TaxID=2164074 RepID=UPI000DBE2509|nr:hypothetical protein [Nakamurella deserti]